MPVALDLVVQNLRAIRAAYTHIKVYSSATEDGVFAEATRPTTRIPLTDATSYAWVYGPGNEDHYYRIAYWNQRTSAESAQGPAIRGRPDPALEVISIDELKEVYLFGVDLTDDNGTPYSDGLFRWYIKAAVAAIARELDIELIERTVVAERVDYYARDFSKFQYLRPRLRPLVSVSELRLVTLARPSTPIVFPAEWLRVDTDAGTVEVVPMAGALALPFASAGALLLPTLYGSNGYLPHVREVDYVAGFPRGQVPDDIRHAVGMMAACGPLNVAGDLIAGAGIANYSMSLDGLSQSVGTTSSATNSGYGARILQYTRDLKSMLPRLRAFYKGIPAEAI